MSPAIILLFLLAVSTPAVTNARKYLKSRGRPSELALTGVTLSRAGMRTLRR